MIYKSLGSKKKITPINLKKKFFLFFLFFSILSLVTPSFHEPKSIFIFFFGPCFTVL